MEGFEISRNIYAPGVYNTRFGSFTEKKAVTTPVDLSGPKDSFEKKKIDANNDGKFSFKEFGKNMVKGVGQFFVDIYKNVVENPLFSIPAILLIGAMASTPVGLAFVAGGGIFASAFAAFFAGVKTINNVIDKKWDDIEKQGIDYGKIIPGAILSVIASVKAIKQLDNSATLGQALGKAADINTFLIHIAKNIVKSPYRLIQKMRGKHTGDLLLGAIKTDWTKFVNGGLKKPGGNRLINMFFRPELNKLAYNNNPEGLKMLSNAMNKPFSPSGFVDFKFGLGKDGRFRNLLQPTITALRNQAEV